MRNAIETTTVYHAAEQYDSEGSVQKWRLFLRRPEGRR